MTAPTTTLLHEVDAGHVEYDRADERFLLNRRPLTFEERREFDDLITDGLVFLLDHEPGVRFTPVDTTRSGKAVASR